MCGIKTDNCVFLKSACKRVEPDYCIFCEPRNKTKNTNTYFMPIALRGTCARKERKNLTRRRDVQMSFTNTRIRHRADRSYLRAVCRTGLSDIGKRPGNLSSISISIFSLKPRCSVLKLNDVIRVGVTRAVDYR